MKIKIKKMPEEKSMQLIDDSYYPTTLNVPRSLFTNFTAKNSAKTMMSTDVEMATINKMNKNLNQLNYSTTTKTKDSSDNGMMKIPIVRNELHIGKISIENHGQLYVCRTINTNVTRSIDIIVRLEVFGEHIFCLFVF